MERAARCLPTQVAQVLNSRVAVRIQRNLVDDRVPESRHSHASSCHELYFEAMPARSVDLVKHSVQTHFPEDRKSEISQRTKITRAPC